MTPPESSLPSRVQVVIHIAPRLPARVRVDEQAVWHRACERGVLPDAPLDVRYAENRPMSLRRGRCFGPRPVKPPQCLQPVSSGHDLSRPLLRAHFQSFGRESRPTRLSYVLGDRRRLRPEPNADLEYATVAAVEDAVDRARAAFGAWTRGSAGEAFCALDRAHVLISVCTDLACERDPS